jgi:hypothetical protein
VSLIYPEGPLAVTQGVTIGADVQGPPGQIPTFIWSASGGTLASGYGSPNRWFLPPEPGAYVATLTVAVAGMVRTVDFRFIVDSAGMARFQPLALP